MLSSIIFALFVGQAFGGLLKGALGTAVGIQLLNRRLGYPAQEGVFTKMVSPGFFIIHNSPEQLGKDISVACQMFEDLKPFEGMQLFITESEGIQLRALVDATSVAMLTALEHAEKQDESLLKAHEQAVLCARALAIFLARLPAHRCR